MTIKLLLEKLDTLFPFDKASSWDNVGLQIGDPAQQITSILTTLDVTKDVIHEAIKHDSNCIIAHHPLIFQPLKTINYGSVVGEIIQLLIENHIALIITHTNFDVAKTGMNHVLANTLQLKNQSLLIDPVEDHAIGIIGTVDTISLKQYISTVKSAFQLEQLRYIGNDSDNITTIAIIGGSGSSYLPLIAKHNIDCFITGDVTYHKALDARNLGLSIIDVGHYVEQIFKTSMKQQLQHSGITCTIKSSTINTNPYKSA